MLHPFLICFLIYNHTGFLSGSQMFLTHVTLSFLHMPRCSLFSVTAVLYPPPLTWLSSMHPSVVVVMLSFLIHVRQILYIIQLLPRCEGIREAFLSIQSMLNFPIMYVPVKLVLLFSDPLPHCHSFVNVHPLSSIISFNRCTTESLLLAISRDSINIC